mmetsp:Transcript_8323/g.15408  ORF Transcript_8323/g.15408 Transcript_8323/m.15408 type:complete len:247 (-) Transcript_8323:839-1579(-)
MLRATTVPAMGQQDNESRLTKPLCLTTRQELVKHDLRSVGKISKLGFPDNQTVGIHETVPKLKPQDSKLRQRRVAHLEASWFLVLQNVIKRNMFFTILLVVYYRVAVRKGASLHILSAQSHVVSFPQQSCERERFSCPPVYPFAGLDALPPVVINLLDLPVNVETLWYLTHFCSKLLQYRHRDSSGLDAAKLQWRFEASPDAFKPVHVLELVIFRSFKRFCHLLQVGILHLFDLLLGQDTLFNQLL